VIKRAQAGDGGLLAIGLTGSFTDPNVTDRVAVNPFFDKNGDGVLDLNAEILPNLGAWVDTDPFVAITRMLPNVYDQAASLRQPVLVLQGENDGSTRVRNTRGLNNAFAGHPDYTLRVYAGLGHSLAPVRGVSYDKFTFYSEQPKADFAAWVLARGVATAAQPVALPSTGAPDRSVGWLIGTALLLLLCGAVARRRLAGR